MIVGIIWVHTHQHTALKKIPVNYIIVVINIKLAVFIVLFMILNEVFYKDINRFNLKGY
jgi:hypothetical protein